MLAFVWVWIFERLEKMNLWKLNEIFYWAHRNECLDVWSLSKFWNEKLWKQPLFSLKTATVSLFMIKMMPRFGGKKSPILLHLNAFNTISIYYLLETILLKRQNISYLFKLSDYTLDGCACACALLSPRNCFQLIFKRLEY